MATKKRCSACKEIKAISKFGIDRSKKSGLDCRCRKCKNLSHSLYKHSVDNRYGDYKSDAKRRGFVFDITKEQFQSITSQKCYYCGDFSNKYQHRGFNGIDRASANEGYFEHNCLPCCMTCNYMKRTQETDDFIKQVGKIYKYQSAR